MSIGRPSWIPRSRTGSRSDPAAERDPMATWCLTGRMLRKHEGDEPAADTLRHAAVVPEDVEHLVVRRADRDHEAPARRELVEQCGGRRLGGRDRKSTRLN